MITNHRHGQTDGRTDRQTTRRTRLHKQFTVTIVVHHVYLFFDARTCIIGPEVRAVELSGYNDDAVVIIVCTL